MSSILFNKDAYSHLKEAVNLLCNAVKVTLGPRGKNVLTINSYGDAHLTKDGITVANNVKHDDPIINGIINVVREASANTAKSAGDGTSTSLVLTQALFNDGLKLIENGCNPTLIKEGMNEALADVLESIEELNETITIDDTDKLRNIATISAAMDKSVGDLALEGVLEAKETGVVKIDISRTSKSSIKTETGLTFSNGYTSNYFTTSESSVVEYEKPLIFISNIELTNDTLVTLMKYARSNERPLVVLAPEFNENITLSMFKNFKSGAVQICPIKLPGFAGNRTQWVEDITAYIDGEVYTSNNIDPIKYLGNSEKIVISAEETSIINDTPKLSCLKQINKLQSRLKEDIEDYERENLNNRVAKLQGRFVTIFVGATTELETNEKIDRVDDAVRALQTALKGGISEGGGMTFLRVSENVYKESHDGDDKLEGYNLVVNCLFSPFEQLCVNSDLNPTNKYAEWNHDDKGYNFKTNQWENLKESGVIDPTLVLKNAITNAVGIASNLLMTECITYKE